VVVGEKSSKYLISYVESLEELKKWRKLENNKPVFKLEDLLVTNPKEFEDRWDKIKFE
jgi:hypothetical protein